MTAKNQADSSLGLPQRSVRLTPADPAWPSLGRREKTCLANLLDGFDCEIQHVGSTAVPGLCAKPIIDIAIGTSPESSEPAGAIASRLVKSGLITRGRGEDGGLLFVRGRSDRRTTYIHVLSRTNPAWDHYIKFRDYLIAHPDHRDNYAQLKTRLAAKFPTDRGAYTRGKAGFIAEILQLAKQTDTPQPCAIPLTTGRVLEPPSDPGVYETEADAR